MKRVRLFSFAILTLIILFTSYGCGCRHKYESRITKPATCAEQGETEYTCRLCGYVYKEPIKKTSEHSYVSEITKEPAEKTTGIRTYTCTVCGASYTEPIDRVPATWKEAYYVDEFGADTEYRYAYGRFEGTFSSSAVTDCPLSVWVCIDGEYPRMTIIKLYKFQEYKVNFTDFQTVTLKTKDSSGTVKTFSVFFDEGDICCSDQELSALIIGSDNLMFSVTAASDYQFTPDTYVFQTKNDGLAALLNSNP